MVKKVKVEKILCPRCEVSTKHEVVWKHEKKTEDEPSGLWDRTIFDVLQCLGCETVTLRRDYLDRKSVV